MNTWYATSHIHSGSCKSGGELPGIPPAGLPWWALVGSPVTAPGGSRVTALRDPRQGLPPLVQRSFGFRCCNNERTRLSSGLTPKGVTETQESWPPHRPQPIWPSRACWRQWGRGEPVICHPAPGLGDPEPKCFASCLEHSQHTPLQWLNNRALPCLSSK